MRPIPQQLKEKLASKKYYKYCAECRKEGVQWHHNLIFGGKQVNAEFCIIPLCPSCHDKARNREFKERLDWMMLNRATEEELFEYSKAINYNRIKSVLNEKYGIYHIPRELL